jgi:hypothetical protein
MPSSPTLGDMPLGHYLGSTTSTTSPGAGLPAMPLVGGDPLPGAGAAFQGVPITLDDGTVAIVDPNTRALISMTPPTQSQKTMQPLPPIAAVGLDKGLGLGAAGLAVVLSLLPSQYEISTMAPLGSVPIGNTMPLPTGTLSAPGPARAGSAEYH